MGLVCAASPKATACIMHCFDTCTDTSVTFSTRFSLVPSAYAMDSTTLSPKLNGSV